MYLQPTLTSIEQFVSYWQVATEILLDLNKERLMKRWSLNIERLLNQDLSGNLQKGRNSQAFLGYHVL